MANALILGATSAVAGELARRFVKRGDRVYLVGRNQQKLEALAKELGDGVIGSASADFNDTNQAAALVGSVFGIMKTVDIALVLHGDLGDQLRSEQDPEHALEIIRTNYLSVVALMIPLVDQMRKQGYGKIGVVLSVAGDRGRPRNFTYGSAKGALGIYLQGWRSVLYGTSIDLHSFKLGPVDSPMTVDHEKNFSFSSIEKVAGLILRGLESARRTHYVPGYWFWVMLVVRWLPEPVFQRLGFLSDR